MLLSSAALSEFCSDPVTFEFDCFDDATDIKADA
jgi:hypothetical protein